MLPCCNNPRCVRRCAAPAILRSSIITSARTGFAKQLWPLAKSKERRFSTAGAIWRSPLLVWGAHATRVRVSAPRRNELPSQRMCSLRTCVRRLEEAMTREQVRDGEGATLRPGRDPNAARRPFGCRSGQAVRSPEDVIRAFDVSDDSQNQSMDHTRREKKLSNSMVSIQ
jgi:hypothetical protein